MQVTQAIRLVDRIQDQSDLTGVVDKQGIIFDQAGDDFIPVPLARLDINNLFAGSQTIEPAAAPTANVFDVKDGTGTSKIFVDQDFQLNWTNITNGVIDGGEF